MNYPRVNFSNKVHAMKFYDREEELRLLAQTREQAFSDHSRFTVITGRRRIGKTKLILRSCEGTDTVYLFVARRNEGELCQRFASVISSSLGILYSPTTNYFSDIFSFLMELGRHRKFNLVIDEFQEFAHINESIFSEIQDVWDRLKDRTHVNLIVSGSVNSMMNRIFRDAGEPLYGRADRSMRLTAFGTETIREIMADFNPQFDNDDLLALYCFTGGVPKYVEMLMEAGAFTMEKMVDFIVRPDSFLLEEGNYLLIQEFGKKYGNYYSILSAIASGRNTMAEILSTMKGDSIGGQLRRLEEDYGIIRRHRPILAKEGSQTLRFSIADNFLRFWFKYIVRNQDYIESGNLTGLASLIKKDYPTYSGLILEDWFRLKLAESKLYRNIGSWWENGAEPNELDVVAIGVEGKEVFIAEVKRQRRKFNPEAFQARVNYVKNRLFDKYSISTACLTLEDM